MNIACLAASKGYWKEAFETYIWYVECVLLNTCYHESFTLFLCINSNSTVDINGHTEGIFQMLHFISGSHCDECVYSKETIDV